MRNFTELNIGDLMYVFCNLRADEWNTIHKLLGPTTIDAMIIRCFTFPGPRWAWGESGQASIVGGFIPQRQGVYSSWFFPTMQAWETLGKEVTQVAINRKALMFDQGAHRIETVCLASNKLAHRWYRSIGFEEESMLKAYCADGTDAMMFVDTRGKH